MSYLSRSQTQHFLIFALCLLLATDIFLRVFDGDPVQATRITGRETDAAIHQLAGTYYQMAAANNALAASITGLNNQLARLDLERWAKAEKQLADSQELLAAAANELAFTIAPPDIATDSGEVPPSDDSSEDEESGENSSRIRVNE